MFNLKNIKFIGYLLLTNLMLFQCQKSVDALNGWNQPDCDNLKKGIIEVNSDIVTTEVNKLLSDMKPDPSDKDRRGHFKNITTLIERINSNCDEITSELFCYACIETLPPQSEIILTVDSSGNSIMRIIDILTPADDKLQCLRVHKFYN